MVKAFKNSNDEFDNGAQTYEKSAKGKGNFKGNGQGIKYVKNQDKKRRNPVDENTKNLRRLYNKLMQKHKVNGKELNKPDIVKKIIKLVNGNYSELCFKHDGCRVLQGSIKYGDKKQRYEIIQNLIPHVYNLISKKYSIYLALKMVKYAENKQKEEIVKQGIYPNFSKIIKNANGQAFLNFAFSNITNQLQNGMVDFYITKYLKMSEEKIKSVSIDTTDESKKAENNEMIIVEKQGTYGQENIVNDIKAHLEKQLEKVVHKTYIFQAFLNKIFDYFDAKTKCYIAELFDDDLNEFLECKQGIELSCKMFTVASAKTRKKIIKKLKDKLVTIINNETSALFLVKIILFTDDTKLVEKHIVHFLIEQLNESFMQNKIILKIFANIISPCNSKTNNQYENKILQYSVDSSSKKSDEKRHEEVIQIISEDIFRVVCPNIKFLISDNNYSTLFVDFVNYLNTHKVHEKLKEILKNTVEVLEIDYKTNFDDVKTTLLSDKTAHFVLNRIIKIINNNLDEDYKLDFINKIADLILCNFEEFLNTQAIFVIVKIMENEKTKQFLEKDVKKYKNLIKKKSTEKELIGFQLLNKIISQ
jgi:pumilio homology domain family member 6